MTDTDWRKAFRRRISAAGYSPRSLSIAAGLSPTAIGDILRGRSRQPRHQTLYRIASVLGCTPEALLDPTFVSEMGMPAGTWASTTALPGNLSSEDEKRIPVYRIAFLKTDAIRSDVSESDWIQGEIGLPASLVDSLHLADSAVLEAPDDAMAPTIQRGDLLLIDRSVTDFGRRRHRRPIALAHLPDPGASEH